MEKMNFKPTIYLLRTELQVLAATHTIQNLPLDKDHPYMVIVRKYVKKRTLSQNSYYWMRLQEIAEQAWLKSKQYHKDAWHTAFKEDIMPDMITTKDGFLESKWIDRPMTKGKGCIVRPTSDLSVGCFADYITAVEAFATTELGVQFKAHDNSQ